MLVLFPDVSLTDCVTNILWLTGWHHHSHTYSFIYKDNVCENQRHQQSCPGWGYLYVYISVRSLNVKDTSLHCLSFFYKALVSLKYHIQSQGTVNKVILGVTLNEKQQVSQVKGLTDGQLDRLFNFLRPFFKDQIRRNRENVRKTLSKLRTLYLERKFCWSKPSIVIPLLLVSSATAMKMDR